MKPNLRTADASRTYQARRPVSVGAYPHLTPGSAHQKALRVESDYLALVGAAARAGDHGKLAQLRTRVLVAANQVPAGGPGDLVAELQDVQAADQRGDGARFGFALEGAGDATAEEQLLRSVYAEIKELTDLSLLLEARKAAR